tara:strand:- start:288 stop:1052 length:765 start_codon:yes stop_codon:yes gene_type:complete
MFSKITTAILTIMVFTGSPASAQDSKPVQNTNPLTGQEVLRLSDEKLIPGLCSYVLRMDTVRKGKKPKINGFIGYKKGAKKNVLIVKRPKRVAGSVYLKKDNVIWSYYTTNHRLTKVAYQAVFMGTLLNYGDILATELSSDYDVAKLEEVSDKYMLTLTTREGKSGYGTIVLTVDKDTFLPEKRSYYALSGILMKECRFEKISYQDGMLSYLEMHFIEPMKERKTIVRFTDIRPQKNIPDKYYNESYIKFLGGE